MIDLLRKKLSCVNCGQTYWAYSPSDDYTDATLDSCGLANFEEIANAECDHCRIQFKVIWHNRKLELNYLLEMRRDFKAYIKEVQTYREANERILEKTNRDHAELRQLLAEQYEKTKQVWMANPEKRAKVERAKEQHTLGGNIEES